MQNFELLCDQIAHQKADTSDVASGTVETRYKSILHWVSATVKELFPKLQIPGALEDNRDAGSLERGGAQLE